MVDLFHNISFIPAWIARSLVSQAGPSHWDVCSCWRDSILMISLYWTYILALVLLHQKTTTSKRIWGILHVYERQNGGEQQTDSTWNYQHGYWIGESSFDSISSCFSDYQERAAYLLLWRKIMSPTANNCVKGKGTSPSNMTRLESISNIPTSDIGVVEIRQFISNNRNRIAVSQKAPKNTICDAISLAWSRYETDIKIHGKDLNDAGLIKCIDLTSALDKRSPKASSTTRSKLSVSRKKTRNYGSSSSTTSNQQYLRASVDVLFGFVCWVFVLFLQK
jgi:hypothetical protein